ncbi:neurexin-3b-beta-like [Ptychodera flava]|uniref:neurexin-3b-beta-like n=1 Tax=Ptychodera flava TaxID=63121 RepID=UPI00396A43F5
MESYSANNIYTLPVTPPTSETYTLTQSAMTVRTRPKTWRWTHSSMPFHFLMVCLLLAVCVTSVVGWGHQRTGKYIKNNVEMKLESEEFLNSNIKVIARGSNFGVGMDDAQAKNKDKYHDRPIVMRIRKDVGTSQGAAGDIATSLRASTVGTNPLGGPYTLRTLPGAGTPTATDQMTDYATAEGSASGGCADSDDEDCVSGSGSGYEFGSGEQDETTVAPVRSSTPTKKLTVSEKTTAEPEIATSERATPLPTPSKPTSPLQDGSTAILPLTKATQTTAEDTHSSPFPTTHLKDSTSIARATFSSQTPQTEDSEITPPEPTMPQTPESEKTTGTFVSQEVKSTTFTTNPVKTGASNKPPKPTADEQLSTDAPGEGANSPLAKWQTAIVVGAVVLILFITILAVYVAHKCRRRSEGSYAVDESRNYTSQGKHTGSPPITMTAINDKKITENGVEGKANRELFV